MQKHTYKKYANMYNDIQEKYTEIYKSAKKLKNLLSWDKVHENIFELQITMDDVL